MTNWFLLIVLFRREMQVVRCVPRLRLQRARPQRHLDSPDQWIPVRTVRLSTQLPVVFVVVQRRRAHHPVSAVRPVAPRRLRPDT